MKKIFTLLLLLSLNAVWAVDFDIAPSIAKMKEKKEQLMIGNNKQIGIYIICAKTVKIKNNNMVLAQETARALAAVSIADFITIKTINAKGMESYESEQSFRNNCAKIRKYLKIYSAEKQGVELTVYCYFLAKDMTGPSQKKGMVK